MRASPCFERLFLAHLPFLNRRAVRQSITFLINPSPRLQTYDHLIGFRVSRAETQAPMPRCIPPRRFADGSTPSSGQTTLSPHIHDTQDHLQEAPACIHTVYFIHSPVYSFPASPSSHTTHHNPRQGDLRLITAGLRDPLPSVRLSISRLISYFFLHLPHERQRSSFPFTGIERTPVPSPACHPASQHQDTILDGPRSSSPAPPTS